MDSEGGRVPNIIAGKSLKRKSKSGGGELGEPFQIERWKLQREYKGNAKKVSIKRGGEKGKVIKRVSFIGYWY